MHHRFKVQPHKLERYVVGPLASHLQSFAQVLADRGYSEKCAYGKIRLVTAFSRWLREKGRKISAIDVDRAGAFLKSHWRFKPRRTGDLTTMQLLLQHLQTRGVIQRSAPPCRSPMQMLIHDYGDFLAQERALAPTTIKRRTEVGREFLAYRFKTGTMNLKLLRADDVNDFVLHMSTKVGPASIRAVICGMRSFLRYLFQEGRLATNLAAAVPRVPPAPRQPVPKFLSDKQVAQVLRSCDRRRKAGKRDYAMLLLFARLGLRAGEVADLALDDIDWRCGELLIRGKGARVDRLPLPDEVGKALVDYLHKARPSSSCRKVFLLNHAPYSGFSKTHSGISSVVQRAMNRAKIDSHNRGAHVLRHSLATSMLRKGASLAQIGQILRHRQIQTTTVYAKVDLKALQALALPWFGGAA